MSHLPKNLCEIQLIGSGTRERIVHPRTCPALARNGIRLTGLSRTTSGPFRFCRLRPPIAQILMVTGGRGRVLIGEEWHPVATGDAYLTPPGQRHAYEASQRWEIAWCILGHETANLFPTAPTLEKGNASLWHHLIAGVDEAVSSHAPLAIQEKWAQLLRSSAEALLHGVTPHPLWRFWQKVADRLAQPWDLSQLAQLAGLGPETLRQQCQQAYGTSPIAYLTRLRMRRAIGLLEAGHKVEYVAGQVGYQNAFAFSTAFKRIEGHPPSHFIPRSGAATGGNPHSFFSASNRARQ